MQSFIHDLYNLPHGQTLTCYFWAMNVKLRKKYYFDKSRAAVQATFGAYFFFCILARSRHVEGVWRIPGSRPWIVCYQHESCCREYVPTYTRAVAEEKHILHPKNTHRVRRPAVAPGKGVSNRCSYARDKSVNITEILESCSTGCVSDTSEKSCSSQTIVLLRHCKFLSLNLIPLLLLRHVLHFQVKAPSLCFLFCSPSLWR